MGRRFTVAAAAVTLLFGVGVAGSASAVEVADAPAAVVAAAPLATDYFGR